jgi:hypothetical protein
MRRRKHAKKRSTHRRRRKIGAIEGGVLMGAVGVIAGAVAAQQLSKYVSKAIPSTMDSKVSGIISGAAPIALGLFMPKLIKSNLGKNLGTGMIAGGGLQLVKSAVPSLAGIGMNYYANKQAPSIAGYQTGTQGNYIAGIAALQEMENC